MNAIPTPPAPLNRPKLARYLWDRDLTFQAAGAALGRTKEWVRLVCLPFDDVRRRIPDQADMAKIHAWTQGEVMPADFYPPHLNVGSDDAAEEVRP
jgi:hypothetical protein